MRARDEFVAIAAHELRNPMTPILMQVSGLAAAVTALYPSAAASSVYGQLDGTFTTSTGTPPASSVC